MQLRRWLSPRAGGHAALVQHWHWRPGTLRRSLQPAFHVPRRPQLHRCRGAAAVGVPGEYEDLVSSSMQLLDESVHDSQESSPEFRMLCHQQLELLTTALHASLAAAAAASGSDLLLDRGGDQGGSAIALAGAAGGGGTTLCAAVYCRTSSSISSGQLQLQLVAHSGPDGYANAAGGRVDQQVLSLGRGQHGVGEQEQWIVEQAVVVLPDSGGLVLPLSYNGFLLGLLVVERGGLAFPPGSDAAQNPLLQPPTCTLLGAQEFKLLRQCAGVLSLACAMDLRALLERAGNSLKQSQVRGLVQQARQPLSTLRTLGAMLAPRLQEGEPDRDMAEGIMAQGDRLAELVGQLQAALHPPVSPGIGGAALPRPPLDPLQNRGLGGGSAAASSRSGGSSSGGGGSKGSSNGQLAVPPGNMAGQAPRPLYPALPSPSIGGDTAVRTVDICDEDWAREGGGGGRVAAPGGASSTAAAVARVMGYGSSQLGRATQAALPAAAGAASSGSGGALEAAAASAGASAAGRAPSSAAGGSNARQAQAQERQQSVGQQQSAEQQPAVQQAAKPQSSDLFNLLMPLLATAYSLCSVQGITFLMLGGEADAGAQQATQPAAAAAAGAAEPEAGSSAAAGAAAGAAAAAAGASTSHGLPCADVAVDAGALKRMLSQLIDGIIATAARGDCVEVAVTSQLWERRQGVAVSLRCLQGFAHAGQPHGHSTHSTQGQSRSAPQRPPAVRQPEFAFLSASAAAAGGWFEVRAAAQASPVVEDARHVQHLNCSSVVAVLWLPVVAGAAD